MKYLVLLALTLAFVSAVNIEKKYDGVSIGNPNAPFHLEAYIDLLCSDCKEDHETWKQVFRDINFKNQDKLRITYHMSPNVAHIYAWPVEMVQHYILEQYGDDAAFEFQGLIFDNQSLFANKGQSFDSFIDTLATFVSEQSYFQKLNFTKNKVTEVANTRTYDLQSRNSWKFGGSKSITGTPEYYANGAQVANNRGGWTVSQWLQFLQEYAGISPSIMEEQQNKNFLEI